MNPSNKPKTDPLFQAIGSMILGVILVVVMLIVSAKVIGVSDTQSNSQIQEFIESDTVVENRDR